MLNKTTRREMLRNTTLAGFGVWAAGQTASAVARSPNERLNVACIGVGGRGAANLNAVAREGENIVALCDVDEEHGLNNIRGNGVWVFEPDLAGADCRRTFYDSQSVRTRPEDGTGPNLQPVRSGQPAAVVFKVSVANVITSMRIEGSGLRSEPGDVIRLLVSLLCFPSAQL